MLWYRGETEVIDGAMSPTFPLKMISKSRECMIVTLSEIEQLKECIFIFFGDEDIILNIMEICAYFSMHAVFTHVSHKLNEFIITIFLRIIPFELFRHVMHENEEEILFWARDGCDGCGHSAGHTFMNKCIWDVLCKWLYDGFIVDDIIYVWGDFGLYIYILAQSAMMWCTCASVVIAWELSGGGGSLIGIWHTWVKVCEYLRYEEEYIGKIKEIQNEYIIDKKGLNHLNCLGGYYWPLIHFFAWI